MKIFVINGPNLNMLGIRERDIYGTKSYRDLVSHIGNDCRRHDVEADIFQSNCEGEIVTKIQQAYGIADAIIINPAAYTHTSIAIYDALKAVALPAVEVHLSDINSREDFRKISYTSGACLKSFKGMGFEGYTAAINFLINYFSDIDNLAD